MKLLRCAAVALGAAAVLTGAGPSRAQAPAPEQFLYQVRTVWQGQERFTQAAVLAPVPVDATGDLVPDVVVQVLAAPPTPVTGATLRMTVTALPTLQPGHLRVEAVFPMSGDPWRNRIAFGYDAGEGVPESFSVTAVATPAGYTFQAETAKSSPGGLAVVGSLYRDSGGARADEKRGHVAFHPMPAGLTLTFTTGVHDRTSRSRRAQRRSSTSRSRTPSAATSSTPRGTSRCRPDRPRSTSTRRPEASRFTTRERARSAT